MLWRRLMSPLSPLSTSLQQCSTLQSNSYSMRELRRRLMEPMVMPKTYSLQSMAPQDLLAALKPYVDSKRGARPMRDGFFYHWIGSVTRLMHAYSAQQLVEILGLLTALREFTPPLPRHFFHLWGTAFQRAYKLQPLQVDELLNMAGSLALLDPQAWMPSSIMTSWSSMFAAAAANSPGIPSELWAQGLRALTRWQVRPDVNFLRQLEVSLRSNNSHTTAEDAATMLYSLAYLNQDKGLEELLSLAARSFDSGLAVQDVEYAGEVAFAASYADRLGKLDSESRARIMRFLLESLGTSELLSRRALRNIHLSRGSLFSSGLPYHVEEQISIASESMYQETRKAKKEMDGLRMSLINAAQKEFSWVSYNKWNHQIMSRLELVVHGLDRSVVVHVLGPCDMLLDSSTQISTRPSGMVVVEQDELRRCGFQSCLLHPNEWADVPKLELRGSLLRSLVVRAS